MKVQWQVNSYVVQRHFGWLYFIRNLPSRFLIHYLAYSRLVRARSLA